MVHIKTELSNASSWESDFPCGGFPPRSSATGPSSSKRASSRRSRREQSASIIAPDGDANPSQSAKGDSASIRIKQCGTVTKVVISEQYLADVLSEKAHHENSRSGRHRRRMSRVGVWRPHLESISEVTSLWWGQLIVRSEVEISILFGGLEDMKKIMWEKKKQQVVWAFLRTLYFFGCNEFIVLESLLKDLLLSTE